MSRSKNGVRSRPTADNLSIDTIYRLLSARRRRYTLYCLYRYANPVALPDVADQVTRWERTTPQFPEDRLYTYNDLYHCHVPKLADAGIVSYCQSEDVLSLGENAAQLRPYLEQAAETDLPTKDIQGL